MDVGKLDGLREGPRVLLGKCKGGDIAYFQNANEIQVR